MPDYFKAVAVDFDGTLTTGGRPEQQVLEALAETRAQGRRLLLVTGRVLDHLLSDFGDVDRWFDAIVAENGAVIRTPLGTRTLADPVDSALTDAMTRRGIGFARGQVIVGCDAAHDHAVLDEIRGLGVDYQLARNRAALMIIPAGITKATGLVDALDELGLSPHSVIGVGDAENDHALLERCEVGVAVANAVDALKQHADLITQAPNGRGVVELLRGDLLQGSQRLHPDRWQIPLGTYLDGTPATIPASQLNVLVTGGTQAGKSYLAGLIAERLIQLAYSVVVIDTEGDHTALADLHDVVQIGGRDRLPSADLVRGMLSHHGTSIIVDLSQLSTADKQAWYRDGPPRLGDLRAARGLPHWIIVDEAHESLGHDGAARQLFTPSRKGHCLVTYHPTELCAEARDSIDVLIALTPTALDADDPVVTATALFSGLAISEVLDTFRSVPVGSALLSTASEPRLLSQFRPGSRLTAHVRHWHKYAIGELPAHRRFLFRRGHDHPTGAVAANLRDFHLELARCEPDAIAHHALTHDFSRWIRSVFRDDRLAAALEQVEDRPQLELARPHRDRTRTAACGRRVPLRGLPDPIRFHRQRIGPHNPVTANPGPCGPGRRPSRAGHGHGHQCADVCQ